MKRKASLVFLLFLALGVTGANALPQPADPPPEVSIPYTGVFEAPADCAAAPVAASYDPGICSPLCAQVICRNKPVNSPCGFGGGGLQRYCYEEPIVCSDGPACRCTNVPP